MGVSANSDVDIVPARNSRFSCCQELYGPDSSQNDSCVTGVAVVSCAHLDLSIDLLCQLQRCMEQQDMSRTAGAATAVATTTSSCGLAVAARKDGYNAFETRIEDTLSYT